MTDRTPLRAFFAGADPTSIGEMQPGDTALVPSLKSAGAVQMGADATATRNFTWTPDGAGGLTLARGVMGATTQDILKVDAAGFLTIGKTSAFRADNNSVAQVIPSGTPGTLVNLSTERYDLNGDFASSAWVPPAGRPISMIGGLTWNAIPPATAFLSIYKNGLEFMRGTRGDSIQGSATMLVAAQDVPNGTDSYTLRVFQNAGAGNQNTLGDPSLTYFAGLRL